MRGAAFLKLPLPSDDARMRACTNDEQLSNVCRDIEARMVAEGADTDACVAYEELRERHVSRMFAGARAG